MFRVELLECSWANFQDVSSDVAYFLQKGDELRREGSYQEAIEVRKIGDERWWPGKT